MPHFGIFSPPIPGHVNPLCALGRTLVRQGHQVTVFHIEDLRTAIQAEGLNFVALQDPTFPAGTLVESTQKLANLTGIHSLNFAIECECRIATLILEQAPQALQSAGVEALLVDQNEPAGGTVAEYLKLPFVSVCTSLPLNRESCIPPPFAGWSYEDSVFARVRNKLGYTIADHFIRRINNTLNRYRKSWGLTPLNTPDHSFSKAAQIAQMPREFDFPRKHLPDSFHYCGPWFDDFAPKVNFPFEKLDGRPLIYGSLGTLQQKDSQYFHTIAEACCGWNVQLVLSLGAKEGSPLPNLPGNPLVVSYAPQLELLSRAAATITHSGMNTTLQSLYFGVPLVAIPLTHDQPAIAARLARTGAGIVIPPKRLTPQSLRTALKEVLGTDSTYRENALRMRNVNCQAGGVKRAAEIVESLVGKPHSVKY